MHKRSRVAKGCTTELPRLWYICTLQQPIGFFKVISHFMNTRRQLERRTMVIVLGRLNQPKLTVRTYQ